MVWDFVIPQPGDILHFHWPWGRKGNGREEDVDYINERLLSLGQAAKLLPGRQPGKPIAVVTISRWCLRGLRGNRLRSVMVGGSRYTTRKWCDGRSKNGARAGLKTERPVSSGYCSARSASMAACGSSIVG